jgi:MGT family glycosyltransferase
LKTIVFLLDFYVGTALPTFHLASTLKERGYRVAYLGIPDLEPYVTKCGFTFHPIMEEVFPKGTRSKLTGGDPGIIAKHFKLILESNAIDRILHELKPELVVANYFLSLEALVLWYKHKIPTAIFCSFLRETKLDPVNVATGSLIRMGAEAYRLVTLAQTHGCAINSISDLVEPLRQMPEIIGCPLEFDLPGTDRGTNTRYIEPCIRENTSPQHDFNWPDIDPLTKLIYISLGSQVVSYVERGQRFYSLFFDIIRQTADRDWYYIFSFSPHFDAAEFGPLPDNVGIHSWVPQLDILNRAHLSINHGGLGSIKECIFNAVPMLVYPLGADQFKNSERVKIRKVGDIGKLDVQEAILQIETLVKGGEQTSGLNNLQEVFRRRQEECRGAAIVENIVEKRGKGETNCIYS